MKYLPLSLAVVALFVLGACSTDQYVATLTAIGTDPDRAREIVSDAEDASTGNIAGAMSKYCAAPANIRAQYRDKLNAREEADGAMAGIWCPGDEPLSLGVAR